jgi:hypothetical protein
MSIDASLLPGMLYKRQDDTSASATDVCLYVVMPSADQALLSFQDFSLAVSAAIKKMNDFAFIIGMQRILKLKQLKDMTAYLDKISGSFEVLNNKVDETKLLAINTLINSSMCGLSGETFSGVVKQVNALCNQSKNFLVDIKTGFETTHLALDSILALIKSTIETELNVMTTLKTQVDYYLGKLETHQQYQSGRWAFDYHPFQDRIENDFQQLLNAMLATHDHVVILLSKRNQDMPMGFDMDQRLLQLKNLCGASILLR